MFETHDIGFLFHMIDERLYTIIFLQSSATIHPDDIIAVPEELERMRPEIFRTHTWMQLLIPSIDDDLPLVLRSCLEFDISVIRETYILAIHTLLRLEFQYIEISIDSCIYRNFLIIRIPL